MFAPKNNTTNAKSSNSIFGENSGDFIQPKLNVGKPGDKYEVEADKAADQIVSKSKQPTPTFVASSPAVQKQTEDDIQKQESENEIQQKPVVDKITPGVQLKVNPFLQKQSEEDVQTKEEEVQEKEDEEVVQQKSGIAGDASGIENQLSASKGGGSPLDNATRSEMESGFGTDFSGVRVHNDSNAIQMNQELGSQAFTNGNDIYFNEGKYNPGSDSGKHLLAHELTHTVQQGASPSIQPKIIQRAGGNKNNNPNANFGTPKLPPGVQPQQQTGIIFSYIQNGMTTKFEPVARRITLPLISVSDFKSRNGQLFNGPYTVPAGRSTKQGQKWSSAVGAVTKSAMDGKIRDAEAKGGYSGDDIDKRVYFFKGTKNKKSYVFGNKKQLYKLAEIPTWDIKNNPTTFQIDHIVEHQLGGKDKPSNFELLDAAANGSSGSSIAWQMNKRIMAAHRIFSMNYYKHILPANALPPTPKRGNQYVKEYRRLNYQITFLRHDFNLPTKSGNPERFWSVNQIKSGKHLNRLQPLSAKEVKKLGNETNPALFLSGVGGRKIDHKNISKYPAQIFPRGYLTKAPDFDGLQIEMEAYNSRDHKRKDKIPSATYTDLKLGLTKVPNAYIFYVGRENLKKKGMQGPFQSLRIPGMSPIKINTLSFNDSGFYGEGKVLPTIPLIKDADVDIIIDGDGVRLRKLFTATEFNFPKPFSVDQATLEVSYGTNGLGFQGQIDFGIDKVGNGFVKAGASQGKGLELEGEFNFDSKLFDPAKIKASYKDEVWTIGGEIGIKEGKVKGVKSAKITATYSENTFKANGEAELDIPGIDKGSMSVEYSPKGFSLGGKFNLNKDIPGIKGGSVEAKISKKEGEEGYGVFVSGTAQPDVPGINSSLTVTYDNGALTIEGKASYARGMLSGEVTLGATNRAIGDDGKPSGEIDDTMRVYGGGSLTLQLTPWLKATAGVKFLPNGEMEVMARLDAPSYEVFKRQEVKKNLFTVPTIEIPLFAIPLGPKSIGLVAQIGGGLDFKAGFGPGKLRNMSAEITYNPDREEETTVKGHGEFVIPADAGLTLRGDLSIGASIAIASITGGIELAGTLGLQGEALASVDVNWSPQTGLAIDALGSILVSPKFKFDINAFIRGTLGAGWLSISKTWRKNLLSYEWGSGIEFGVKFPVNYKEGEPFSMSFDDIEVVYPELDIPKTAKSIAKDVKNKIF